MPLEKEQQIDNKLKIHLNLLENAFEAAKPHLAPQSMSNALSSNANFTEQLSLISLGNKSIKGEKSEIKKNFVIFENKIFKVMKAIGYKMD